MENLSDLAIYIISIVDAINKYQIIFRKKHKPNPPKIFSHILTTEDQKILRRWEILLYTPLQRNDWNLEIFHSA